MSLITPFQSAPNAAPVRLIVRRVQPTPGSQLALFVNYSYYGFITDRDGDTLELEADHRGHAEIENAIRDLKYGVGLNHLPSGRFAANGAWLAVQVMAHNLARWAARIGLGEQVVTTKTLRRRFFSIAGRLTRSARRLTLHLPQGWPWENQFGSALRDCAPCHSLPDGVRPVRWTTEPPGRFAPGRSLSVSCCTLAVDLARRRRCGPSISPLHDCHTLQPARSIGVRALHFPSLASHLSSDRPRYIPSVDSGLPIIPCVNDTDVSLRWIRV